MTASAPRLVSIIVALLNAAGCANQVAALKLSNAIRHGTPEACFGVARAGHNDCKSEANICAGWSRHDADPGAFIYLPSGTCQRIVGGTLGTQRADSSS
jgi:uncharacterized membrane protein